MTFYLERKKPVKTETFRQSSTWPSMLFLNIKMAGWGRYHKWIKMLVSSDCLCPESWNNYLPERNRRLIIFMAKKKKYLFTLWSFHLQSMKGIKICPLKLHPINFCPKFGRSPIQWKIIDTKRKTLPGWYKFSRWFLALSRFSPFTLSLMAWQESEKKKNDKFPTFHHGFFSSLSRKKVISCGRSYTSPFAFIKMNKKRF